VQVEVHDVEARRPGPEAAEDGVEVGAVHVRDGSGLAHRGDHLVDLVLEDAERARIGDHERRHIRAERRLQRVEVDPAALVRSDRDGLVADHGGRRRVRAVRRVRHEDLRALLALAVGLVEGAGHQHAGQLAVGAGRGLEADGREAGDLLEQLGQQPHELQAALAEGLRVEWMRVRQPRQPRGPLVDLGVVLHRAGAERVEPEVDGVVEVGKAVEVAQEVELADLRQARCAGAQDRCGQLRLPGGPLTSLVGGGREADGTSLRA
jgi:hypothetical protein